MKPFSIPLLIVAILGCSGSAFAEDKTPNLIITGTVTSASCTVETSSQTLTVPLPDILTGAFAQVGDTGEKKEFSIKLKDCDDGVSGATITFSGTNDSDNPDLLQITKGTGSATGVGVEIIDETTDSAISPGQSIATKALTTGDNTLVYQLRYKSTLATVTAGSANAVMYFDLVYQ